MGNCSTFWSVGRILALFPTGRSFCKFCNQYRYTNKAYKIQGTHTTTHHRHSPPPPTTQTWSPAASYSSRPRW